MKTFSLLPVLLFIMVLTGCRRNEPAPIEPFVMPYFNQLGTDFDEDAIQCLLDQYYAEKYPEHPVTITLLNNAAAYKAYFACSSELPAIDFTSSTLIVGMKAGSLQHPAHVVRINRMQQELTKMGENSYELLVTIEGDKPNTIGGEWFGFTHVAPKMDSVVLGVRYIAKQ